MRQRTDPFPGERDIRPRQERPQGGRDKCECMAVGWGNSRVTQVRGWEVGEPALTLELQPEG